MKGLFFQFVDSFQSKGKSIIIISSSSSRSSRGCSRRSGNGSSRSSGSSGVNPY
jgi:hypothetical protein